MSYPDDAEYPYVDLAELADPDGCYLPNPEAFDTFYEASAVVEGTGLLPYLPPAVPDTDDEDTPWDEHL